VPIGPDPSGHVSIKGEVLIPAERIEAIGNYGRFGFRRCAVDARVRLPRFSVDCETRADDPSAMIELAAFAPGRITGPFIATLIVWPSGRMPAQYLRPSYGSLPVAGTGADFPANLVGVLNQVRKEAGLRPVVFNADESSTAARVAPQYFASLVGTAPEILTDRISLGLRAGWQIPGLVRYGHFTSAITRNTNDATAFLVSALNRPTGRETLLDPDIKVVAIGPTAPQEGVLAGIFTSYALLEPAKQEEAADVLAALNAKRKERGLAPATLVDTLQPEALAVAKSIEIGQKGPEEALQELLQRSASTFGSGVEGWILAADKFERLPFPDNLLMPWAPRIAIGVAHFRPRGSPWGALGALIVAGSSGVTLAGPPLPRTHAAVLGAAAPAPGSSTASE
jgi:uncharacterized protein YkwD